MIYLFDGCYCSEPKIFPKNWNDKGASIKDDWYIWYRFYDPTCIDRTGRIKPKLIPVAGMNKYKTLAQRREATKILLANELILLKEDGWNPITKAFMIDAGDPAGDITAETPFIRALIIAKEKLDVGHRTRVGIKSVIAGVEKAATQLRYDKLPIGKVSRKYIKRILERCGENSNQWSATRYNQYRAYLLMLFKELVEQEAVTGNPVRDISKKAVTQKIRLTLTAEERRKINDHLAQRFPRFLQFIHLFFHSGGRKTELLQLKPGNVDLQRQIYRCIIKKGKRHREIERTIKTIAVSYWETFLHDCPDDHYLIGPLFVHGSKPIGLDMPSHYWKKYVKDELNIAADLYSLKHSNTSEVVDQLDEQAAASLNGHSSTGMVIKIYDVKQKDRQHEKLKSVNNIFA